MDSVATIIDTAAELLSQATGSDTPPCASGVQRVLNLPDTMHLFGWAIPKTEFYGLVLPIALAVLGLALIPVAIAVVRAIRKRRSRAGVTSGGTATRGVLVGFLEFYGDDLKERHCYEFRPERLELAEKDGQPTPALSEPLKAIRTWMKGSGRLLVVCGSGGLGKSRLLIEAAKTDKHVRFAPTRLWDKGNPKLAEELAKAVRGNDIVVFDDCQEFAGDFGSLLKAAIGAGARVIAATRYYEAIETTLQQAHAAPEVLELGPMANAAAVVPEEDKENLKSIGRIANGNPAIAVMAYMHFLRTGNLRGIYDRFGLMKSVLKELVEIGEEAGFADTRTFLAEMAVRAGLWQDHPPFPGHEALVPKLKTMGHIWTGGSVERGAYGIAPDALRDHIIQEVYAPADVLQQTGFGQMLGRLPEDDAVNVIRMLGIQFRETEKDVWKQACRMVLEKYKGRSHEGGIGFTAGTGRKNLELLIDIGYEAWKSFGNLRLVVDVLEDFCAGAEKLDSVAHLNKAAMFYHQTGEIDQARECYEQGLRVAEKDGDKTWAATFLGNIGLVWKNKGEWDKALEYHEKALKLDRELGDKQGEAQDLGNIGNIYILKGEWDKALEYHGKALKVFEELGAKQEQASVLGNIGLVWQNKGEWDKALEYQEKALKLDRELGGTQGEAQDLGNIGSVYVGMMMAAG
ncbi:MAG: tetratricopeptide repeat protein, partial [candidate division WOR-3 bacterium]|nr:tetratricopeptide repeat protein [candidate division WOR-3 bacterium]